jgi:hypothetical protein
MITIRRRPLSEEARRRFRIHFAISIRTISELSDLQAV